MDFKIKNLDGLLSKSLGPSKQIVDYAIKNLTAPGENYGSIIVALTLKVKNKTTNETETLNLIAKTPPTSEFMKKMFQTDFTFKKELEFYNTIVPTLVEFQRELGIKEVIDFVPDYYGGRLSLTQGEEYDENAIIVLNNLKILGYDTEDRMIGFNYETTKLILKDLATLHALPIALKQKHPKIFQEKILPYLVTATFLTGLGSTIVKALMNDAANIIKDHDELKKYVPNFEGIFQRGEAYRKNPPLPSERYGTVTHCDFWVNNTMLTHENGKAIKNKFVDFQMTEYNTPAKDFIFFMFISVQNNVVLNKYDDLLQFYHNAFVNTLKQHNVDTSSYTLEDFLMEMETAVKQNTILQCLVMIRPIFATKGNVVRFDQIKSENQILPESSKEGREKMYFMVKEFAKRNWL